MSIPLAPYLRDIRACPRFSAGEERQLSRRARRGDAAARELLVRSVLPLGMSLVMRLHPRPPPDELADLVQEANVAILTAVDRFRPARGRLTTLVTICVHNWLARRRPYLRNTIWVPLTARQAGFAWRTTTSLAEASAPGLAESLKDDSAEDPAEATEKKLSQRAIVLRVRRAIDALPNPRLREIITGRMAGDTLEAVGQRLGITRERVRQLEQKAHAALTRILQSR